MDLSNIQSIIGQNKSKYIINQLLRFCCIEIPSDYREFYLAFFKATKSYLPDFRQ